MPRCLVSVRLPCGQCVLRLSAANSCSQKVRARKPRSSSLNFRSMSQRPGSVVRENFMRSDDFDFRNRDDEFAAGGAIGLLLRKNFIGKIPRQQEGIVRLTLEQFFGRQDRQVRAGREPALFVSAAIHYEIQITRTDTEEI